MTEGIDADGVRVERFEMVDEFLARLQQADDIASGRRFLFRGVPNAAFHLTPSALRLPSPFEKEAENEDEQQDLEIKALRRFRDAAYYGGLTIPNWASVQEYLLYPQKAYLRQGALEFIAIAQHYGTPTTLLDWTLDPFVAAYFAASDFEKKHTTTVDMAIWRFDPQVTKDANSAMSVWEQVRIPFDINQNARAQRGVFIEYKKTRNPGGGPVSRDSLIDAVRARDAQGGPPLIRAFAKFVLPRGRTKELMNALRLRHRMSASVLFPGYHGAGREERERCQFGDL